MALAVESHPQREKIIEALLNGESAKKIAKWVNPRLSHVAIYNFRNAKVSPALTGVSQIANSLQAKVIGTEVSSPESRQQAVKDATRTALTLNPILERMERRRLDRERILQQAEADKDYRAWAAVDRNEITATELEMRATGQLGESREAVNVQVALFVPRGPAETPRRLAQDVEFRALPAPEPEK